MNIEYTGTNLSDTLTVNSVFTVLTVDFSKPRNDIGESHSFHEIIYINKGEHRLLLDGEEVSLMEGQLLIYAPDAYHCSCGELTNAVASIISFETTAEELDGLYNRPITLNLVQKNLLVEITETGINCFEERDENSVERGMILKKDVQNFVLQRFKKQLEFFLADLVKTENSKAFDGDNKICKSWYNEFDLITKFMIKNISSSLTLEDIANAGYMSTSKLKLIFRSIAGTGPLNYFNILKIEESKKLIRETEYNITQVSNKLGFNSVHYFSRLFKKITGVSPTEYEKTIN